MVVMNAFNPTTRVPNPAITIGGHPCHDDLLKTIAGKLFHSDLICKNLLTRDLPVSAVVHFKIIALIVVSVEKQLGASHLIRRGLYAGSSDGGPLIVVNR